MNMIDITGFNIHNIPQAEFEAEFYKRNPSGALDILKTKTAAIAGAGGLGSNIASLLVRSGVYNLIIADFDSVELSNLNRQQFFYNQIGALKTEALKENLLKINPYINITTVSVKITEDNAAALFAGADILIEALDGADMKAMLIEAWCRAFPRKYIVAASGLAGIGRSRLIKPAAYGNLIICGDQISQAGESNGLIAPRVAMTAALQANCAVEILFSGEVII